MRSFLIQIIVFSIVCCIVLLSCLEVSSFLVQSRNFKNHETEGNTLVFKQNEHYNIMISGISHARNFSRHKNHLKIESLLDQSVINIAQGSAMCGVNEQFFYLKYFYNQNNSIDKLIYVVSPPMLYSEELPLASNTFKYELFSTNFLFEYLKFDSENKSQRLIHYIQTKLQPHWLLLKPYSKESMDDYLDKVDTTSINNGFRSAYGNKLNDERFNKASKIIEEEIKFAKKNKIEVYMLIPPTSFGQWPGHESLDLFLRNMQSEYGINYHDFSNTIFKPEYYYDHHHLNSKGVEYFIEHYLSAIFSDKNS